MNRIVIKHPKSNITVLVSCLLIFWLSIIIRSSLNKDEIIGGIIGTVLFLAVFIYQWCKSIILESDRIIFQKPNKSVTIYKKDLYGVDVKTGTTVLTKSNGVRYEVRFSGYTKKDISFMRDYFVKLKKELVLLEDDFVIY